MRLGESKDSVGLFTNATGVLGSGRRQGKRKRAEVEEDEEEDTDSDGDADEDGADDGHIGGGLIPRQRAAGKRVVTPRAPHNAV